MLQYFFPISLEKSGDTNFNLLFIVALHGNLHESGLNLLESKIDLKD